MKEEEERRAGAEDLDENVEVTYTTEESRQVKKSKNKSNIKKGKEKAICKKQQPKSGAGSVKPREKPSAGAQSPVVSRAVRSTRRSAVENRDEGVS